MCYLDNFVVFSWEYQCHCKNVYFELIKNINNEYLFLADSSFSTSSEEGKPKATRKTEVTRHLTGHITRVCWINLIILNI
jgi:hypothetical protein